MVLDAFAKASNIHFEDKRYGFVAETTLKGRKIFLLKPTTFMNLSGNAVRYWLNQEKIDQSRLLVISDELALPLGAFRLKANGSNGGHNGLGHIQQLIGQNYARLRMGIDNHLQFSEDEAGTKVMFARENRARERYNKCRAMDCKMEAGSYFEEK